MWFCDDAFVVDDHGSDVEAVRERIVSGRIESLIVDDLVVADLTAIGWSGSALHIVSVGEALRRPAQAVEYLCVRAPSGAPMAKGGVDFEAHPGAGTLWQLAVHPALQGLGLGTHLIAAAEERIRRRGLAVAQLGVDDGNDDALRLYVRLGYTACGRWASSWPALDEHGVEYLHEAEGTELSKAL